MRKKMFIALFMLILCIPMVGTSASAFFETEFDVHLVGYTDDYKKPKLLSKDFLKGQYQKEYEDWWANNLISRGVLIKSYNQIRLSAFGQANRIVGEKNNLYEYRYIQEYLCLDPKYDYSLADNKAKLAEYLRETEEVSAKLKKLGKCMILYTAPNKCDYTDEDIPKKYKIQAKESRTRAIDILRQEIGNYDICYVDGRQVIDESGLKEPVFYNSGIHWSRPAEQLVSARIMQEVQSELGTDMRTFVIGDRKEQTIPFWRDDDIWDLINVWKTPRQTYYEYDTHTVIPEEYGNFGIMIQGDSYMEGFRKDVIDNEMANSVTQVFYDKLYYDEIGYKIEIKNGWEGFPMQQYLDRADAIVVGVNELFLADESSGFIHYLNEFLDSYTPITEEYLTRFDVSGDYAAERDRSFGYYSYEDGFAWAQKYSSVTIENADVSEKGLEICFTMSDFIEYTEEDYVKIYVNGKEIRSIQPQKGEEYETVIPAEEIKDGKNIYMVDIYVSKDFVPHDITDSEDYRNLAVRVKYIGEVR